VTVVTALRSRHVHANGGTAQFIRLVNRVEVRILLEKLWRMGGAQGTNFSEGFDTSSHAELRHARRTCRRQGPNAVHHFHKPIQNVPLGTFEGGQLRRKSQRRLRMNVQFKQVADRKNAPGPLFHVQYVSLGPSGITFTKVDADFNGRIRTNTATENSFFFFFSSSIFFFFLCESSGMEIKYMFVRKNALQPPLATGTTASAFFFFLLFGNISYGNTMEFLRRRNNKKIWRGELSL